MPSLLETLTNDLPNDPPYALYEFLRRTNDLVLKPPQKPGSDVDYRVIATYIREFAKRFGIKITSKPFHGPDLTILAQTVVAAMKDLEEQGIGTDVEKLLSAYESSISANTFGFAKLNPEEKKKIHDHLSRVRKIIEESGLSERKRNALYERLNKLAGEVDLHGTKTDRFFAFAGDIAFVIGDMATKARPAFDEVREILKIVSRARARQEGVSLPAGDEPLKLTVLQTEPE